VLLNLQPRVNLALKVTLEQHTWSQSHLTFHKVIYYTSEPFERWTLFWNFRMFWL